LGPWGCQISWHRALQGLDQGLNPVSAALGAATRVLAQQLQQDQALLGWVCRDWRRVWFHLVGL
jgi:hypothetical protein